MNKAFMGLVKKEFIQVFRDKLMVWIIFALPIIQLLLLGYVANLEVKDISLDVYDFDQTQLSRDFVRSTEAGKYFTPTTPEHSVLDLDLSFREGSREMALVIPEDFSEKLTTNEPVTVGLIADGTDANSASLGSGYMAQIARKFSQDIYGLERPLKVRNRVLYNPEAESVHYMIPAIVATLLTIVTVLLTSMAIVREKETGTLEQILVTPISKGTFLAGKVIPFAVLGMIELTLALAFGVLWFKVPFVGSALLLLGLSALYLLTTLGIGLFFSTVTSTQQQAMFFAWFFLIFALLTSGFFTPIANMPQWTQYITYLNPMRYFMEITRGIMMKGAGFVDLLPQTISLIIIGVVVFGFSSIRFSKRTG
ncbi:MAG: ABC transporter permease [candidate division Zixibacteria bacterium]|nr:ABC transporter permease [candidate division Zixibacteria bacterium]